MTRRQASIVSFAAYVCVVLAGPNTSCAADSAQKTSATGILAAATAAPKAESSTSVATRASLPAGARAARDYGKVPLSFEANQGQTDNHVRFLSRGKGYTLFLTPNEAVLALSKRPGLDHSNSARKRSAEFKSGSTSTVLRMKLLGANRNARIIGTDELPGRSNYFIGNDPKKWHTDLPTYKKVAYRGIYPGIDLVYYGNQRELEYDFVIAPGADPRKIRLEIEGAQNLRLDDQGNLVLYSRDGEVRLQSPQIYQELEGKKQNVRGFWKFRGKHNVGFGIERYDLRRALIIDPTLVYSTFLGGTAGDDAGGIAVDAQGNTYVVGSTHSEDFPGTQSGFQPSCHVSVGGICSDAFVVKLAPAGDSILYSTYLGGTSEDVGYSVAVDPAGSAYVTGYTLSSDFPVLNAIQSSCGGGGGGGCVEDAFITKLNAAGDGLVYSTYLGGSERDHGYGIAIDSTGNVYVSGDTFSTDFPISNAIQETYGGGGDAFVTKLNATGDAFVYSTYLGGSKQEAGFGISVDPAANVYLTGRTDSSDFPTVKPVQPTCPSSTCGFVTKLNPEGSGFVYSTYFGGSGGGGSGGDDFRAIASDAAGNAYVTGTTGSLDYPTVNALQPSCGLDPNNTCVDAFVTKLSNDGSHIIYSTYLGGNGFDSGDGIAIDSIGNTFIVGSTSSTNFPAIDPNLGPFPANAVQAANAGGVDNFVVGINPAGNGLLYSTYLGGSSDESSQFLNRVAADSSGNVYITGSTQSANFPTVNPLPAPNDQLQGPSDAFVSKLPAVPIPACQTPISQAGLTIQPSITCTGNFTDGGNVLVFWGDDSSVGSGGPPPFSPTHTYSGSGTFTVILQTTDSGGLVNSVFQVVTLAPINVTVNPSSPSVLAGTNQQFTATVTNASNTSVTWSAAVGSITSTGLYTAPAAVTHDVVTALSNADGTTKGISNVQVTDFSLSLSSTGADVAQGGSASTTLTVNSVAYAGTVNLSCTGLPAGSTCAFNPAVVSVPANGSPTSSLTISTSATTPVGLYSVTISATDAVTGASRQQAFNLQVFTQTGCGFALNPTSQSFTAAGGSGTVAVTGTCTWTAASNDNWITITFGSSGSGNGTVAYSVAANTTTTQRTGTLTIAGLTFTVTQSGEIGVTVSPNPASVQTGGTQQFLSTVINTSNTAVTWSVTGTGCSEHACGAIDQTGLYTAPAPGTLSALQEGSQTDTVTATSQADPTASGSTSVTVFEAPSVPQPPPPQTVTAGQSTTYQLAVAPNTGDTKQPTTFSCAPNSLPNGVACDFTPPSVTFGPAGASFQLGVRTTAQSARFLNPTPGRSNLPLYASMIPLAGVLLVGAGALRRRRLLDVVAALLLCSLLALMVACGTNGTFEQPPPPNLGGTPPGTYTIVVRGQTASQATQGVFTVVTSVTLTVH